MGVSARDLVWNRNAVGCPHPAARERAAIQVSNDAGDAMDLCVPCKMMFERILERHTAGDISNVEIRTLMRRRGYDRADADRFISDLEAAA